MHYEFVSNQSIETLRNEIFQLNSIPFCIAIGGNNMSNFELEEYKRLADLEMLKERDEQLSVSQFWLKYKLDLIVWFKASRDVALIVPSSATIERVFSLLTQGFMRFLRRGECHHSIQP